MAWGAGEAPRRSFRRPDMRIRLLALISCTLAVAALSAADWPQWRGPKRGGFSVEADRLKGGPEAGAGVVWKNTEVECGFYTPSGPVGKVYVIGSTSTVESAISLEAKDGKGVWKKPIGKVGRNTGPNYPGSR